MIDTQNIVEKFRQCNSIQETADAFSMDWKDVADIIFRDNYKGGAKE